MELPGRTAYFLAANFATTTVKQEAEVEKTAFLAGKTSEKESALTKAQHAETALEELKERYRELRRQQVRPGYEVRSAERIKRARYRTKQTCWCAICADVGLLAGCVTTIFRAQPQHK